jgi:hypothetical protein
VVALSLAGRSRAGHRLDPGRAGGHDRRQCGRSSDREGQRHQPECRRGRDGGRDLRRRGVLGRAVLRAADRSLRSQEAVHDHARGLHRFHDGHGVLLRAVVLLPGALLHRCRHRRRVCGDQLGHRRADPCPRPRSRGPDHQRVLLAGLSGGLGSGAGALGYGDLPDRCGLAGGVWARGVAGAVSHVRAPQGARESALAVHPRPGGGSRTDRRRDRAQHRSRDRPAAGRGDRQHHGTPAQGDLVPRDRPRGLQDLSQAVDPVRFAVRRPGVSLQRRHVQPRHADDQLLWHQRRDGAGVHHHLRGRQPAGTADAGAAVRHDRAKADDRRHLSGLGGGLGRPRRALQRGQPDLGVVHRARSRGLLPGFGGGQRGLPDRF